MARKRVVFLINSLTGGGAERVMCTLLHHSQAEAREFDITLAVLDDGPRVNVPPEWLNVRQLDCRGSLLRSMSAVRALFEELQPDATLSFLTRANVSNVAHAQGVSIISERTHTSAHFAVGARGLLSRAMVRMFYPRATRVIAVSEGVAKDLEHDFAVPHAKLIAIGNPVDIAGIEARARGPHCIEIDGPYILGVGRFVADKNFELLIRGYAASGDARKLVIAGDGEERALLEATVRECGLADRVIFPGFVTNPYPLMKNASVFVLSSRLEGFPNVLVESMAMGIPVIATNCESGPSEILAGKPAHAVSGLTLAQYGILTPTESVENMAEAIRKMGDEGTRAGYATKGRERADHYDASAAKDRYWDVIREALSGSATRRASFVSAQ